ncbi:MAG: TIGR00282 family metallophosphoesterase [Bdellovibrionales bacterium]|nr:TIGR00282 family metallophosphoesterase [Bdellovibrionales bacterium]
MKFLFIGDIVGEAGRKVITRFLPALRAKHNIDIVIANNENMAGGFGITADTFQEMSQAGVDIMTGGNHTFDKKEGVQVLEEESYVLRPANYPEGTPGKGSCLYTNSRGQKIGVINVMGRVFMDPLECPFREVDKLIAPLREKTKVILVDVHAEASSEKVAMGWHCDGRATLVVGTHTHVQTADERILPGGTAYLTDAGMTGPYDSVIGIKKEIIIDRFITRRGKKFEVANGDPWLCGILVEADEATGHAISVQRIRIEANRPETHP